MKTKLMVVLFGCLFACNGIQAQKVGVKTNLIYWGTATTNLAVEFATGKKTTIDLLGTYNPFQFNDNKKWKHYMVQPEFRWWNCERFIRGFWGVHLTFAEFNVGNVDLPLGIFPKLKDYRFEGWTIGAGISYGYQWYLGPHWNLEATIGFGYQYADYKKYVCAKCGDYISKGTKHYFGPTKVGLSFVYLFKSKK